MIRATHRSGLPDRKQHKGDPMRDAIIVGGGIAGMSAAWRLRHSDIIALEAGNRIGGRLRSERRGKYWLNWGGHVFGGEGSYADKLLKEVGVDALDLPGSFSALSFKGKTLNGGNVNLYPFKLPLSWGTRWEIVKAGLKVMKAVKAYGRVNKPRKGEDYRVRQQRIYDFMADKTFAEFTGPLSPDADAFFRPTVSRSSGDPEEISAGAGVGYFLLVWDKGAGLARNIVGGAATLPQAIGDKLGDKLKMGAEVLQVVQHNDHVEVTWRQDGKEHTEKARYCVMTTPATITHRVTKGLHPVVYDALGKIKYGHYVSAAFLTNETGRHAWDDVYAYCTPQRSFNIAFNMSNLVRSMEGGERAPGSSFMVFSPATLARNLINLPDEKILEIYRKDLEEVFPGFGNIVVEQSVQKFHDGLAYCFPGRNKVQPMLMRAPNRIYLAGDYLGSWYTETAIQTGLLAGEDINSKLYTDKLLPDNGFSY